MATWTGGLSGKLPGVSRVRPFLASDGRPLSAPGLLQGFILIDLEASFSRPRFVDGILKDFVQILAAFLNKFVDILNEFYMNFSILL